MRKLAVHLVVGALLTGCAAVQANPPCATPCPTPSYPSNCLQPGTTTTPGTMPGMSTTPGTGSTTPSTQPGGSLAQGPTTDAFAQAPPSGGEGGATALPNMIGDLGVYGSALQYVTSTQTITTTRVVSGVTQTIHTTRTTRTPVYFPIASRGAFKITENESPRPQDRVFVGYNYYSNVSVPGSNAFDIHRETLGFEKAFLDGNASFGIRMPVIQTNGSFGADDVGDISFITKYAFYNDRETGNLLSGGLVVTAPTGPSISLADGSTLHSTLLQPYVGYIWTDNKLFVQGFSSIVVPTDSRDVTFFSSDTGVGYHLTERFIPTLEAHVNVAFDHRGEFNTPIGFADSVVLTGGFHTLFGRSVLTVGLAVPVTGPKQYDVEAVAQFNFKF